jgi:phage baseplate assembly protein gpV
MSGDVVSLIQAIVSDRLRSLRTADLAVVTAVHPHGASSDKNNCECDVKLRDTGLMLKRVPVATQRIGAAAPPNVDDLVLVQYLNGDLHAGIITGRIYNDKDRSPVSKNGECVYVSPDPARSGVRRLYLEFPNGNVLTLDDDALKLEMGKTVLTVKHDGEVVIDSGNSDITLKDANGSNKVAISPGGGQVTVQGQTKVTVDAPMIELVSGSTHPLVHGDQLLQYLANVVSTYASHVHPGQMAGPIPVSPAPPMPPLPPPTPSLVSTKVMTG